MRLLGRQKIYTDVDEINENNVVEVLQKAYAKHKQNVLEMQYLIDYERGEQPLKRVKTVRADIDIRVNSSLPNYIKKFKVGYNWGSPILLVQRGNKDIHNSNADIDDTGISALNEVLKNGENISFKDQQMAEFIEICGIGHRMVEAKIFPEVLNEVPESLVNVYTLDSRFAFMVYQNGPGQKKMMGVSFAKKGNKNCFTCFTETTRYEIEAGEITKKLVNPLGQIPIVEYERSVDRTGCFERKIKEIDALNILESDFANDVSQRTQELWWGDNIDFKTNEKGEQEKPQSGDWILTYSSDGKVAKIAPLSSSFNGDSTLNAIKNQRATILQDCYVPIQYESSGGGSTGTATDMASGWSAAELDALQEQQLTERGKREELRLILQAIKTVPSRALPSEHPIRKIHASDIEFRFMRRKEVDMSVRSTTFATLVSHGINGRHALEYTNMFMDSQQVYIDSKDGIEAYQKTIYNNNEQKESIKNNAGDPIHQIGNSPIIDKI